MSEHDVVDQAIEGVGVLAAFALLAYTIGRAGAAGIRRGWVT